MIASHFIDFLKRQLYLLTFMRQYYRCLSYSNGDPSPDVGSHQVTKKIILI